MKTSLPGPLAADAVGGLELNLDAIRRVAADAPEHGVMPRSVARS